MNRIALYPGSFDPMTNGHLDVLLQALNVAPELEVAGCGHIQLLLRRFIHRLITGALERAAPPRGELRRLQLQHCSSTALGGPPFPGRR